MRDHYARLNIELPPTRIEYAGMKNDCAGSRLDFAGTHKELQALHNGCAGVRIEYAGVHIRYAGVRFAFQVNILQLRVAGSAGIPACKFASSKLEKLNEVVIFRALRALMQARMPALHSKSACAP